MKALLVPLGMVLAGLSGGYQIGTMHAGGVADGLRVDRDKAMDLVKVNLETNKRLHVIVDLANDTAKKANENTLKLMVDYAKLKATTVKCNDALKASR